MLKYEKSQKRAAWAASSGYNADYKTRTPVLTNVRFQSETDGLPDRCLCGFSCGGTGCPGAAGGPAQRTADGDGACVGVLQGGFQRTDGVKEDRRQAAGETHRAELSQFWIQNRVWKENEKVHENVKNMEDYDLINSLKTNYYQIYRYESKIVFTGWNLMFDSVLVI